MYDAFLKKERENIKRKMEEINKKQMYYLLISTIFHQSQNTNTTLQNSLKLVEELEKKLYMYWKRINGFIL